MLYLRKPGSTTPSMGAFMRKKKEGKFRSSMDKPSDDGVALPKLEDEETSESTTEQESQSDDRKSPTEPEGRKSLELASQDERKSGDSTGIDKPKKRGSISIMAATQNRDEVLKENAQYVSETFRVYKKNNIYLTK